MNAADLCRNPDTCRACVEIDAKVIPELERWYALTVDKGEKEPAPKKVSKAVKAKTTNWKKRK